VRGPILVDIRKTREVVRGQAEREKSKKEDEKKMTSEKTKNDNTGRLMRGP